MCPRAQQVAIAEACGWIKFWEPHRTDEGIGQWMWHKGKRNLSYLPDYLSDLNAMREAEETLTEVEKGVYADFLALVVGVYDDYYEGITFSEASKLIHITAAQRAEAFLKAKGLWIV